MEAIAAGACILLSAPLALLYFSVGMRKNPKKWRHFLPFFLVAVASLSYSYEPINEPDLFRYFEMLSVCRTLSFQEVLQYFDDGLIVKNIIFFIIAKTNDFHLLPLISTTTVYGIAAYITCDTAERYQCEKSIAHILLFQLMALPFISIVNNIRNIAAFSLVCLAVYRDLVKEKRNITTWLLYVFPCFIHTSVIMMVLLRVAIVFTRRIKILVFGIIWISPIAIDFAYSNMSSINIGGALGTIIDQMILKAYWYLHDTDSSEFSRAVSSSLSSQLDRVAKFSLAIFFIWIIFVTIKKMTEREQKFSEFCFLIAVATLACSVFTTPHYWRFSSASVICMAPLWIPYIRSQGRKLSPVVFGAWANALFLLFMQIWKAQYITDAVDLFFGFLTNNIYVIIKNLFFSLWS